MLEKVGRMAPQEPEKTNESEDKNNATKQYSEKTGKKTCLGYHLKGKRKDVSSL